MSDHCESKRILVDIQDNGIIRRADTGYLIGNLSRDYPFSDLCNGTGEVDEKVELYKCTVCGKIGEVGRCCGIDTRVPFKMADTPEMPERIKTWIIWTHDQGYGKKDGYGRKWTHNPDIAKMYLESGNAIEVIPTDLAVDREKVRDKKWREYIRLKESEVYYILGPLKTMTEQEYATMQARMQVLKNDLFSEGVDNERE